MEYYILFGLLLITVFCIVLNLSLNNDLTKKNKTQTTLESENQVLRTNFRQLQDCIDSLQEKLDDERINNAEILSQKKSSETRLGMISEHLVPMLANFPYKPEDAHFLGQPVDYIIYDLDQAKIVFLEVKSGNSKLSKRQKIIKNIIQQGRVFYEEIRINEKGIKVKHSDSQSPEFQSDSGSITET